MVLASLSRLRRWIAISLILQCVPIIKVTYLATHIQNNRDLHTHQQLHSVGPHTELQMLHSTLKLLMLYSTLKLLVLDSQH